MKEQDRHNNRRPSRPEGDVREPRIRRPDLDSEENVTAEREAFFQDFDLAAKQQTGEPYYPEDQGYSGEGYTAPEPGYDPYRSAGSQSEYGPQEDYDQEPYKQEDFDQEAYDQETYDTYGEYESESYDSGAYRPQVAARPEDSYRQEGGYRQQGDYRQQDAYDNEVNRRQEAYEPYDSYDYEGETEQSGYYPTAPRDDEEAPWQRVQADEDRPREPNPMVEKAKETAIDALKGAVLWIRLFFSQDPRRAMSHALKGQETFSFIPVFLILILLVPIQTLLAFQASAAGLNAQISAFQGLTPVVTPGAVYGSDLLRYVLEFVIITGLYFGLLKLLQTDRKIEGAVSAVAVSYFPQIFLTPIAIILNYVSLSLTSALMGGALILQFVLLGHGLRETLELEASAVNGEKQRTWFWLYIAFVVVAVIARALVIQLVAPTITLI